MPLRTGSTRIFHSPATASDANTITSGAVKRRLVDAAMVLFRLVVSRVRTGAGKLPEWRRERNAESETPGRCPGFYQDLQSRQPTKSDVWDDETELWMHRHSRSVESRVPCQQC